MDNFLIVAGQVVILFVLMAVGAVLRRTRLVTDEAVGGMVNLLILVVTPCLIVDAFQRPFSSAMLKGLGLSFGIAVGGHLAALALAYLLVRHRDADVRRPLLLATVFSNAGFMGLPLEQAILGDVGVFYAVVYITVFNLFIWSWGYQVMQKGSRSSFFNLKIFVNPGTVSIAVGLPFFLASVRLPSVLGTPVHLIAGLNTPLAMIVIGYGLWGAKLGRVVRLPCVYVTALIRLVGYPLLVVGALYPFRHLLDHDMMIALVISASAPIAAMVPMFAAKFGRDVDTSVAAVSGTTLLSILTMPAVIAFAMSVL